MKPIAISILVTAALSITHAAEIPPDVLAARTRYAAALAAASKPIRDRYVQELQQLKSRAMMAKNLDAAVAIDSEIKTTLGGSPETALLPVAVEPIAANPGDQPPANGKLKAERTKLNKLLPQKPWINIGNIPWVLEFSEGGKVLYYTAGFKDKATKGTYTWTADNALHIDSDGDGKPDMATQPTNIGNDTLNMYTISGEHRGRLMHERKGVKLEK